MYENRILYEDTHILVCHKPAGIATQTARIGQADMVSEMENYLARKQSQDGRQSGSDKRRPDRHESVWHQPRIYVVHRLDQPVEGILVFARQQPAAAALSVQAAGDEMEKSYLALVCDLRGEGKAGGMQIDGQPAKQPSEDRQIQSGTLTDYLLKDGRTNTSRVVPSEVKGAKEARLSYEILQDIPLEAVTAMEENGSAFAQEERLRIRVAKIRLYTGRHHQIRVQMANAGLPLLGDRKYAGKAAIALSERLGIRDVALCAYRLAFFHPKTKEKMQFEITPEGAAFRRIRI